MRYTSILGAALLATVAQASIAAPVNFSFGCITNNSGVCPTVSPQMNVAVDKVDDTTVSFTFSNIGSKVASVTEIMWDTTRLSALTLFQQTNVLFDLAGTTPTLGGAITLVPPFTTDLSVVAPLRRGGQTGGTGSTPVQNGIRSDEPGDLLVVHGTLVGSYADFLDSMRSPVNGHTRIGLNVNDIQSATTPVLVDSMLTEPTTAVVPVPPALPLLAAGLAALGLAGRRRRG